MGALRLVYFTVFIALLVHRLCRSLVSQGHTIRELRRWAENQDMEIIAVKPCGRPLYSVLQQFPRSSYSEYESDRDDRLMRGLMPAFRYYRVTVIDRDHMRRSGVARVVNERTPPDTGSIDFVWSATQQLNWRDRPPRRSAELPPDRAEGWYSDHTGAHGLRWYSVGSPTDLVKDGAVESRDAPGPHAS